METRDIRPMPKTRKKRIDIEVEHVSMSYPLLKKKPQINGIELVGNKTSKDLGLMSADWNEVNKDSPAFISNKPFQTIDTTTLSVDDNNVLSLSSSVTEDLRSVKSKVLELDDRVDEAEEDINLLFDTLAWKEY